MVGWDNRVEKVSAAGTAEKQVPINIEPEYPMIPVVRYCELPDMPRSSIY
jgi:hypothetical protein